MKREKFRKYAINARALPSVNGLGWSAELDLEEHTGDGVTSTPFAVRGTYASEEAALDSAIVHGRKKIDDGFTPGLVYRSLRSC